MRLREIITAQDLPILGSVTDRKDHCESLRLNESLTEAIALGHDLGHTPFGHSGEAILNVICEDGFTHYEQSVRVVEKLEKMEKV